MLCFSYLFVMVYTTPPQLSFKVTLVLKYGVQECSATSTLEIGNWEYYWSLMI